MLNQVQGDDEDGVFAQRAQRTRRCCACGEAALIPYLGHDDIRLITLVIARSVATKQSRLARNNSGLPRDLRSLAMTIQFNVIRLWMG